MHNGFFVTGTDTNVGKTIVSAWLMLHMQGVYWKPLQSGQDGGVDIDTIKRLTNGDTAPTTYTFSQPLSPHEAAKRDGVEIDITKIQPPVTDKPLIIEGAGGLMVPLNKDKLIIDLIVQLQYPIILVARSGLGTINHTLLSLEAMKTRGITVAGIVMNGKKSPHNRAALEEYGQAPILAEIDHLPELTSQALLSISPEMPLSALCK